ncbi:LysR family transcriptional regulator [Sphaerisporangium sp. TRM90804]|uniref:LysR family transcriptional regulator n=1 Tax=Sphaerisporangium sp. TRM90804 TaxID=3031113 RepID=UPI00244A2386|nr:LysR family transcriptional regulator [Sphaerisporangium sp. TRM90804]MDH2425968.1 LysR family transcriptional regulator [Sphaerisporangium sp. TRM90804]
MDVLGAWRAFVNVSERGSFTEGAAATRVPQSVASRRIAALEKHLGERLFDRSSRGALLTHFGRDMLPSAKRLVRLADDMEHEAERAKLSPLRLAVPDVCTVRDLALLDAEARRNGVYLDFHAAAPAERAQLARSREVRAALTAVPPGDAAWSVPLGLAGTADLPVPAVYIETLRAGRTARSSRRGRVWIQPEDDVPHVRDRLFRLRDSVGLQPAQVAVAATLTAAAAEVLGSADLLLCSARQAEDLRLHWRPVGEVHLVRGFEVAAAVGEDAERIRTGLWRAIARCLGAEERDGGAPSRSRA